jgi:hypothetical protein
MIGPVKAAVLTLGEKLIRTTEVALDGTRGNIRTVGANLVG